MILVFARVERTLLSVAFDFNAACHPEATCLSSPKDLDGPRESPAVSAGDQIARLARFLIACAASLPLPRNTNGADQKACAAVFLTLYIQNVKPDRVNATSSANLYLPPNQSFKQKCSRSGS
jgi:hypothetical protein